MEDGVKFIFKTLIKVPIVIFISYLIFNIFSYTVAYFRLYSLSQMINSIVMENNYLPGTDTDPDSLLAQVNSYMDSNVKSSLLVNPQWTIETYDGSGNALNNGRVQYGNTATVTVQGDLVWLMPLLNIKGEYLTDGVAGLDGVNGANAVANSNQIVNDRGFNNYYDPTTGVEVNNYNAASIGDHGARTTIRFRYTVPCMKYYADIAE